MFLEEVLFAYKWEVCTANGAGKRKLSSRIVPFGKHVNSVTLLLQEEETGNTSLIHASPVLLLASLNSDLSQSQGDEQTKMPCHHVQPELITESWASWEVGKILSNALGEQSKQTLAIKSRHSNVRWNEPSGSSNHKCQGLFVQPFISLGSSTHHNGTRTGGTDSAWAGSGDSSRSSQKSCKQS